MNPNKRILISEGLKKILELKMFYKNHALAWTIFYDNFPKATDFKWKKRMPQESEIIFVFTVKNTNILYMPGLFNHPSKIKLKRKYKEKNSSNTVLKTCALLCQNGIDRYHARNVFPALNEAVCIKCGHHFPFSILQGPFRFPRDINYK